MAAGIRRPGALRGAENYTLFSKRVSLSKLREEKPIYIVFHVCHEVLLPYLMCANLSHLG